MKIVIFTKENCTPCDSLKRALNESKITYDIVSIEKDIEGLVKRYKIRSAPTTLILEDNGEYKMIVGYSQRIVEQIKGVYVQ